VKRVTYFSASGRICKGQIALPDPAHSDPSVINLTQDVRPGRHHDFVPAAQQYSSSLETARFPGGPFPFMSGSQAPTTAEEAAAGLAGAGAAAGERAEMAAATRSAMRVAV
jgi:hypothetical protein